jgi:hypothetical protein
MKRYRSYWPRAWIVVSIDSVFQLVDLCQSILQGGFFMLYTSVLAPEVIARDVRVSGYMRIWTPNYWPSINEKSLLCKPISTIKEKYVFLLCWVVQCRQNLNSKLLAIYKWQITIMQPICTTEEQSIFLLWCNSCRRLQIKCRCLIHELNKSGILNTCKIEHVAYLIFLLDFPQPHQ